MLNGFQDFLNHKTTVQMPIPKSVAKVSHITIHFKRVVASLMV